MLLLLLLFSEFTKREIHAFSKKKGQEEEKDTSVSFMQASTFFCLCVCERKREAR